MNKPTMCPHCHCPEGKGLCWIQRAEPDWDSDELTYIEDSIWECSNCHTLFRARWELISFRELLEKEG